MHWGGQATIAERVAANRIDLLVDGGTIAAIKTGAYKLTLS